MSDTLIARRLARMSELGSARPDILADFFNLVEIRTTAERMTEAQLADHLQREVLPLCPTGSIAEEVVFEVICRLHPHVRNHQPNEEDQPCH